MGLVGLKLAMATHRFTPDIRTAVAVLSLSLLLGMEKTCATDAPPLIGIIRADTTHVLFAQYLTAPRDVTGDGCPDLLVSSGRRFNYLYKGGRVFDSLPYLVFDSTNSWHTALGDINHDGWPDFGIPGRSALKYKMGIYLGGPQLDTVRDYWFGSDSLRPTSNGCALDVDLDGHKEFVGTVTERWEAQVFRTSPWDSLPWCILPTLTNYDGSFSYEMAVGDYNGDGHDDLAIGLPMHDDTTLNGRVCIYFAQPDFDTLPDLLIQRPDTFVYGYQMFGTVVVSPGDMNGDGADELFVSSGSSVDPLSFLYLGGPSFDAIPDVLITQPLSHAAKGGDINRDGYADLIASFPLPWDGLGSVYVWYGGPVVDSIPDIRLDNWQYPGYHVEFGRDVVGLGDYNGDGVDDFAFSMYDADTRGLIYIYSGTGTPNDVQEGDDPLLPTGIELHQNYPNPFNAETQITFSLPRKSSVTLTVIDLLGRQVATLLDGARKAGTHTATWDATNASSGVYFYLLEADGVKLSRKMLLLK